MNDVITQEQSFIDRAYVLLDKGLADGEQSMACYQPQHRSTARAIQRALEILRQSRGTGQLVFGKMAVNGESLYVGRQRVRDDERNPVVIGWHAPAARPFYEATVDEPGNVTLKRVFQEEDRRLVRVIEEINRETLARVVEGTAEPAISDALLAELDRSRDGAMRDVVATIQREQFAIIRHPLARSVIVQGGPGTGKTVVGLHRAAWLAFNHPELRERGVLVVAPSTTFLTYVSGVLPSLNVTDVDQVEIQALYAGEARASGHDDAETARVKGSAAMAVVLRRALNARVGWGDDDITLSLGADRIRIPAGQVRSLVADVRGRDLSHSDGRELLRTLLSALALELHRAEQAAQGRPVRVNEATIRRLSGFVNALDRMWPTFTPEEFLRTLYSTQTWLVEAADGVLTVDERARLYRPATASVASEPWTEEDLYCLDEVEAMLSRDAVTYGHIVVDEAQDLSPMQARGLRRRCPTGSFTMLGDLAQATGPWIRDSWDELVDHLGGDVDVLTLSVGYRVPAPVLELATGQLSLFSPDMRTPVSIREGLGPPRMLAISEDNGADTVLAAIRDGLSDDRSVAVIVADHRYDEYQGALSGSLDSLGDGRDADFSQPVTLLPASSAKGLEFDTIVLVEPADITAGNPQGARILYIAMTRCTQALTVIHADPLPVGFPNVEAPRDVSEAELSEADVIMAPEAETADDMDLAGLVARLTDSDRALVERIVLRLLDDEAGDNMQDSEATR